MKPIVFARIADMKYYRGITDLDTPFNGGSFVGRTGYAHECYNFFPIRENGQDYEKCIGYFQLSGGRGARQLHIEKIVGCRLCKDEEEVSPVHVVFVSKAVNSKTMRVVGFYKNATVYRHPQFMTFEADDEQEYWFEAKKEDCVLLPYTERHGGSKWFVPAGSSKYQTFGFGRSHIWFAGSGDASAKEIAYVEKMIQSLESYQCENWMDKEVS